MDSIIADFIAAQTCANICGVDENGHPYCFSCFYSFDKSRNRIYFKSSAANTKHGQILLKNPNCAGTILEDKLNPMKIKGLQFEGKVSKNNLLDLTAAMHYHAKHPVAMAIPGDMWTIALSKVKFTDNTKGFGTKFIWEKDDED